MGILESVLASLGLLFLIVNIKYSARFNHYDRLLHEKLLRQTNYSWWKTVTLINEPKLAVVLDFILAGYLLIRGRLQASLWVLATLGFTDEIGIILKKIIKRERPAGQLVKRHGYSFPSGHVLSVTIMALICWQLFHQSLGGWLTVVLMLGWLLVVLARLGMRAHYPADILGATLLAILCFNLARLFLKA